MTDTTKFRIRVKAKDQHLNTTDHTTPSKIDEPKKYRIKIVAAGHFCAGVFLQCMKEKFNLSTFDSVIFCVSLEKHRHVCVLKRLTRDVAESKVADVNTWLNIEQKCSCKSSMSAVAEVEPEL